jgi:predicted dehydrogenase
MDEIGIIMNGVTGRMGTNQHLIRSILAIREEGGVELPSGERVMPDPVLVGRNERKLRNLSEEHGVDRWTADPDLESCLDGDEEIYFDSQITPRRPEALKKAIEAGKDIYCEKPLALDLATARDVVDTAEESGVKHGIVQDKLWLPGLLKLQRLIDQGFFGEILSVQIDFGYWVFEGDWQAAQRPSWNYRKAEGGGIILDMLCHWRYVLDNLFGDVQRVFCLGANHIPERVDERGERYAADADDAAYAIFELAGGIVAQINSSWCTRVRRDDLLTVQVDGTHGSAVAGLRDCWVQSISETPRPVWNPDQPQPVDLWGHWQKVPNTTEYDNAFKAQWERFLRHVKLDEPFPGTLREGAKGVQMAEAGMQSWRDRQWVELEPL